MGNNNATAILTEEESSKLETNGMSPLESVLVETTQDQEFLAGEDKGGDKQKDSFSDGVTGKEAQETESQSKELVEDPNVKKVEQEMHQNGLERLVMETDEQLQKQTSVAEGVKTVYEATEVDELSMIGTQSVVRKLNTIEFVNEDNCVIDEIVFVSPSIYETVGTEVKMISESLEEIVHAEEVVKLDQEIGKKQRTVFPKTEPQETLNLEYRVLDDHDEVTNEGKTDQVISKPASQVSNAIPETGFEVYKKERDIDLGRESCLKRMSRCRSLPVSHHSRAMGDSLVQQLVSEATTFPSRNNLGLDKANSSEVLLVSCLQSNKVQETTEAIAESNKEARLDMKSPSFSNDLKIEERSDESTEEAPLISQDKTYKATLDVEEKTVMLKKSKTETTRGFELSLGLPVKSSERSDADNSFKETKDSGDNLMDKKADTSETLLVSCVGSSEAQETTEVITGINEEALVEMRSPSFGNDLRTKERSDESTEQTPLLYQDKIETYEAKINVEKKNVMLKRSESEKTRGFELSLGLSMKPGERSEADDSLKEIKDSGDNLLDKKASWSPTKGRIRKRSKSSLFGTCLCCATAMN